jgi:hypothetical protein
MATIPVVHTCKAALRKLRQKGYTFEANLVCKGRPYFKKRKKERKSMVARCLRGEEECKLSTGQF